MAENKHRLIGLNIKKTESHDTDCLSFSLWNYMYSFSCVRKFHLKMWSRPFEMEKKVKQGPFFLSLSFSYRQWCMKWTKNVSQIYTKKKESQPRRKMKRTFEPKISVSVMDVPYFVKYYSGKIILINILWYKVYIKNGHLSRLLTWFL